jgi:hypothetical protein
MKARRGYYRQATGYLSSRVRYAQTITAIIFQSKTMVT